MPFWQRHSKVRGVLSKWVQWLRCRWLGQGEREKSRLVTRVRKQVPRSSQAKVEGRQKTRSAATNQNFLVYTVSVDDSDGHRVLLLWSLWPAHPAAPTPPVIVGHCSAKLPSGNVEESVTQDPTVLGFRHMDLCNSGQIPSKISALRLDLKREFCRYP